MRFTAPPTAPVFHYRAGFLLVLLLTLAQAGRAQTGSLNSYTFGPGGAQGQSGNVLPWTRGSGYFMAGYSRYGFDSSVVNLIRLDAQLNAVRHREYRLSSPLSYLFTVSEFGPASWLVGGALNNPFGANRPYMACIDTMFQLRWSARFTNFQHSQNYIVQLQTQGADEFVAYTYTDGGFADGMYRVSGNRAGTRFRGREVLPNPASAGGIRVFRATASGRRPDEHILTGTGRVFSPTSTREMDALVMCMDSSRVRWSKLLDFGRSQEAVYGATRTTDGNYVISIINNGFAGSINPTIVCKLDTAGAIRWAREVSVPGMSIFLSQVIETAQQELVVGGFDLNYDLVAVKLSASGNLLWARRAAGSGLYAGSFIRTPQGSFLMAGSYTLAQFDAAGNGCNFVPAPTVVVTPIQPTATTALNFPMTMTPFTPIVQTEVFTPRTQALSRTTICTAAAVGLAEETAIAPLQAWPNPVHQSVRIRGLYATTGNVVVIDALGRTVGQQPAAGAEIDLDLRGLTPGLYTVRAGAQAVRVAVE
jgi:hypothetical protein